MKKVIVSLLCAMMIMSLVACGAENNEANESNNSTVTEDKTDSTNSNSDDQSSADENSAVENDESDVSQDGFINVSIENGFVNIIINHEDMAILDKENTEVWIRFYDSEDRLSGVEITAMKENFVVVPIPFEGGEPLADGYNANAYVTGTVLSFDFTNEEVAKSIGSSEYYEIFIRDWNDSSTPRMIMDGNSESIEGIRTYIASDQEVSEEGNESDEVSIDNQTNSYSQLVGTWEEDSDLTYKARYTFYEDGKVTLEYTESEGADCGENAKFDGVNATWAWTTGDLAGFGGALGPMEGFDGNSFTIPAPNAYEEAKRFIKTN